MVSTKPARKPDTKLAEQYRLYLRQMLLIRRFEEKAGEAYSLGKIGGFCHLYIGQEAVGVGCLSQLRPDDYIVTTYRDHGQALVRGISSRAVMAELFGKAAGCSKGKGGSMHMFDASLGFLGGHGIVGGHIPLAAGIGFAIKYRAAGSGRDLFLRRGGNQQRRLPRGAEHGRGSGSCPASSSARTTATAWALRSTGRPPPGTSPSAPLRTTCPERWWTARICWK